MKPVVILIICLLLIAPSALAGQHGSVEEWYLYPSLQYFTWEESSGGRRLVKEEGLLYGVAGRAVFDLYRKSLLVKVLGELSGGDVGYRGQTQQDSNPAVSERPVSTSVVYIGTKLETDIGWRLRLGAGAIEPFGGFGYRWWLRSLQDSSAVDTNGNSFPVGGYSENWHTLYSRLGLRGSFAAAGDLDFFAEAGGKYPFLNWNIVDYPGVGTVTIKPDPRWSMFAEVGARYGRARPALFYEGSRFGQSPAVPIGGNLALRQPKSDSDIFGISFGWAF
jgi:hypothetical protein